MATILKGKRKYRFGGIRATIFLAFLSLVAVVLILLNTYPLISTRNLIFESKKSSMMNQASIVSTSAGALDTLTFDSVAQVMRMLEVGDVSQIIITDATGTVLYKLEESSTVTDEEALAWGISEALNNYDMFYSVLQDSAFQTTAAMPILIRGTLAGTVCIYEYDQTQAKMLHDLQKNLQTFTVILGALAIGMCFLLSETISRRISRVLDAIKTVREGEYSYRIQVKGHDELAELADEFNSLTARIQDTEEVRRRFVSDASHELKTPLASIRLLSDSILQTENMDEATIREFVSDIGGESERLTRMTEKLLNLTRFDNQVTVERTKVDIEQVAKNVIRVLSPLANDKNVTLDYDCQPESYVFASRDDMFQVILNLMENAVKYNIEGGRVLFGTINDGVNIRMTVEDTGIGVPRDDLPNIFDRFYRVDKARSRASGGSGLGLSIVRSTVRDHGGTVEAARKSEGGMCFAVTLPIYSPTMEAAAEHDDGFEDI